MPTRKRKTVRRVARSMKKVVTSYEKGHLFEDAVERYFQLQGYNVEKNARVQGLSGAVHEIDVLIRKTGVIGVVEAKNYTKPIPKEWVMKVHNVAKDVGATEVYVVSASGFTPDAVKVAEVLGVKLLSLDDMMRELRRSIDMESLLTYYVKPRFSEKAVREHSSRFVEKKLFKGSVERVSDVELLYYPFYLFNVEYTYVEEKGVLFTREVKKKVKLTIVTSAVKPAITVLDEDGAYFVDVKPATKEEAELLTILSESEEPMSARDLEGELSWSRQKIYRLLSSLEDKGLVKYNEEETDAGRLVKVYYSTVPSIQELDDAGNALVPEDKLLQQGTPSNAIEPKIPSANLISTLNSLYPSFKIVSKRLVYLPIYRVKLESLEDDTYRNIYLMASTNELLPIEGIEEE
ncbi:MAG: restriction endonuclease [Desulfurococcaceae archaeon]